jgi:gas vesicle protein
MSKNKSNLLLYGLIFGGIIGAGLAIYFSSRAITSSNRKKKERKHKFFEGIDDIFDESAKDVAGSESRNESDSEKEIVDELFSRSN